MNVPALLFLIASVACVILLPRRWAPIPLLVSCCYMTIGQGIQIGPISLPVYRLVLAAGVLRVLLRREAIVGGFNSIDKMMIAWAAWTVFAGFFHEWKPGSGPIYASGFAYNIVLVYFLTRVWCKDLTELMAVFRAVAWLLVPVAAAMVAEHYVQKNYFGVLFGGVSDGVYWREGKIRAQGPFVHPILAGTVGAVCFPLMVGIWGRYRLSSIVGMGACVTIVLASTSSGPLMSLFIGVLGMLMWYRRNWTRAARWSLVGLYLCAEMLMTRPAYYLISKIDLTGSSTGWHRSRLIASAIENFSEWWLFGTDYTFHWIGIAVDEAGMHSDITNYYLFIGITGGFLAMALVIAMIWRSFSWVGSTIRSASIESPDSRFMIWCLGSGLLAHTVTSLSVSYTDQSMMFFWLNIGAISSIYSVARMTAAARKDDEQAPGGSLKFEGRHNGVTSTAPGQVGRTRHSGHLGPSRRPRSA